MSVGDTLSPSPTTNFAICFTLMTYLASSVFGLMILVQRATCRGEGEQGGGGREKRLERGFLSRSLAARLKAWLDARGASQ